ncbi:OmpA family protein [Oxalobacteraceae bacterium]|nr:OmpA family protein [Oxalobacteraceae bacterium]
MLAWIVCALAAVSQIHPPTEKITLLPSQDGRPSALVIISSSGETVLDQPFRSASIARGGQVNTTSDEAAAIQSRYGTTLAALPQRAAAFLVYFDTATDVLVPESAARLARIQQDLAGRPAPEIMVIGHTDSVDTPAYNDTLSLKRAETVKAMLVEAGIAPERIGAAGRGERELLIPTKNGVAEPKNRRVEIRVR